MVFLKFLTTGLVLFTAFSAGSFAFDTDGLEDDEIQYDTSDRGQEEALNASREVRVNVLARELERVAHDRQPTIDSKNIAKLTKLAAREKFLRQLHKQESNDIVAIYKDLVHQPKLETELLQQIEDYVDEFVAKFNRFHILAEEAKQHSGNMTMEERLILKTQLWETAEDLTIIVEKAVLHAHMGKIKQGSTRWARFRGWVGKAVGVVVPPVVISGLGYLHYLHYLKYAAVADPVTALAIGTLYVTTALVVATLGPVTPYDKHVTQRLVRRFQYGAAQGALRHTKKQALEKFVFLLNKNNVLKQEITQSDIGSIYRYIMNLQEEATCALGLEPEVGPKSLAKSKEPGSSSEPSNADASQSEIKVPESNATHATGVAAPGTTSELPSVADPVASVQAPAA